MSPSTDAVTIGILTALPVEAAAMTSLIDDVVPFRVPADPNLYRIGTVPGRLGERPHVVALALTPNDATRSAAAVCADMLRTFPRIGAVIMAGVAGGVPRRSPHVRLGDIVVADDLVGYEQGHSGLISAELRQASDSLGYGTWLRWLDRALTTAHVGRPSDDLPRVHHGRVGSADMLLAGRPRRDVLAVEMEGAGIAVAGAEAIGRRWFMVRGISDYAGSAAKGDLWQSYASCTSAAYVRGLLEETPPLSQRVLPDLTRIVGAVRAVEPGADAVSIAEALWLAASATSSEEPAGEPILGAQGRATGSAEPQAPPDPVRTTAQPRPEPTRVARPLYDMAPGGAGGGAARKVGVAAGRALPRALEIARALRPLRARWPAGRDQRLDTEATVRAYAETRRLVPMFRPAPELWFDAALVVDGSPGMAAWDDVAREFHRVLTQLGAFRTIRTVRLHLDGDDVELRDPAGRASTPRRLRAADGRRLILVFSDCAGDAWQGSAAWRTLRMWSESTPTALINPLSAKMWDHIGLDLPATRVHAPAPGSPNRALRFRVPPTAWFGLGALDRLLPVPVLGLTPRALGRYADTIMRSGPAGCEAVLTTPEGRPAGASTPIDEPPALALVTAFRRLASPPAHRLAVLAATYERLSLPVLRLIADRVVPEAGLDDIGEVVAGGLFTVDAGPDQPFLTFRPGVREHLQQHLHVDDVWQMYELLSRHVADRASTDRFPVAMPQEGGPLELSAEAVPFALASQEALRVLGIVPAPAPGAEPPPETSSVDEQVRATLRRLQPADESTSPSLLRLAADALDRAHLPAADYARLLADTHDGVMRHQDDFRDLDFVIVAIGRLYQSFWHAIQRWLDHHSLRTCWAAMFRSPADVPARPGRAVALNVLLNFELPMVTVQGARRRRPVDGGPYHLDHRELVEVIVVSAEHERDHRYLERWQLLIATLNGDLDEQYGGELGDYTRDVVWRSIKRLASATDWEREVELLDGTTAALGRLLVSPLGRSLEFETDAVERDSPIVSTIRPDASPETVRWETAALLARAPSVREVPDAVEFLRFVQGAVERIPPLFRENPIADFNRLFLEIVNRIQQRLAEGRFRDEEFVSRLLIRLTAGYTDALHAWLTGEGICPKVWEALFRQVDEESVRPHAAAAGGINASLNFDLPFALWQTFEEIGGVPVDQTDQHHDYLEITDVYAGAFPGLRRGYLEKWQLLIDTMNGELDDWWQGEATQYAANVAWRNAQKLWSIRRDAAELNKERARLDNNAAALGKLMLSPLGNFLQ